MITKKKAYLSFPCRTVDYCISTEDISLFRSISMLEGMYFTNIPSRELFNIEIIHSGEDIGNIINFDNYSIITTAPLKSIKDIMFTYPFFNSRTIALHGAAVEYNNKAIVFLSPTGGGKTTLVSYLTSRGLGYLAEDCVLIDSIDFTVKPFTTPLHLRHGGVSVLKKHGINHNYFYLDDERIKRYIYTPTNCIDLPLEISSIYFINLSMTEDRCQSIQGEEAFVALLKSPIAPYVFNKEYLKALSFLSTKCKKVSYKNMSYIYDLILSQT